MRILILTHGFNSLTQRLFVELRDQGHEVSIEFDINDAVTREAVELCRPDLILAPYLKRAIPEDVWRSQRCIVIHPGIRGDRGPSALDWALLEGEEQWGVTALEANAELDAGDIWAEVTFALRPARKSSVYRHEVTESAVEAVKRVLERVLDGGFRPEPLDYTNPRVRGRARPRMRQRERRIDWEQDESATVLRKLNASDGAPGVLDELAGRRVYLFDGHAETRLRGAPGTLIARRHGAICRATRDGAVWIGQLQQRIKGEPTMKLPATTLMGAAAWQLPEIALPVDAASDSETYREISYHERDGVGYVRFEFYNGAMGTEQCQRLLSAYRMALARAPRVLVLLGGRDFWSNGMHLHLIEQAQSPADESWRNINAIDDLAQAIVETRDKLTIAAMSGNAAAGGVFLALAADRVWARRGVVLNPHYKTMGNLYGSELWTYLLPKRVGAERAERVTESRLPLSASAARSLGLVDDSFADAVDPFLAEVHERATELARDPALDALLRDKQRAREHDEQQRPLQRYRHEELEKMRLNFYGFDPSYHVARYNFVHRIPLSRTPFRLALHRARRSG
jgi:putative two-component system hydrogenase maturation factor HypX/HoxX